MGAAGGFEMASPPDRLSSLVVGPYNNLSEPLSVFVLSCFNQNRLEESKVPCNLGSSCARDR